MYICIYIHAVYDCYDYFVNFCDYFTLLCEYFIRYHGYYIYTYIRPYIHTHTYIHTYIYVSMTILITVIEHVAFAEWTASEKICREGTLKPSQNAVEKKTLVDIPRLSAKKF